MKNAKSQKVAIIGRPNVGKSSLFNRIAGVRSAIVEPFSGTTRDRLYADIKWRDRRFTLIDTAGFETAGQDAMAGLVLRQLQKGMEEADIIFFVTDGIAGVLPQDKELSSVLRSTSKKIFLIVNKIDSDKDAPKALEFFELGLGEPYAVSAMNGKGIEKLCNDLVKGIEKSVVVKNRELVKVAIIGRPNVGKSSYVNSILNEDRVIVHHTAGTTRDAVDTDFNYKSKDYILIDTAGIRHDTKLTRPADFYGSVRSKEAIKRCDVAIVLLDGYEGLKTDDARIIDLCVKEGKALVVAVNKWDLTKAIEESKYSERLINQLRLIRNFPVIFMSCKTGRNVKASLDVAWSAYERSRTLLPQEKIIELFKSLNNSRELTSKRIKFTRLIQEGIMPPRFVLSVKNHKAINDNLKRFVENFLRSACDFKGTPVIVSFGKM